jgi:hypothetical protein
MDTIEHEMRSWAYLHDLLLVELPLLGRFMFWISTAAKRSSGKAAPDGSLNAFPTPSAVMIFAVFTEELLAAMWRVRVGGVGRRNKCERDYSSTP